MSGRFSAVVMFGWVLALCGCSMLNAPNVSVIAVQPATSSEAARIKSIAVLPFEGTGGRDVAVEIEAILASVKIADVPYFRVVERQRLDAVLKEIRLSQSGLVTSEQASRLGRLLGVQGIYVGTVAVPAVNHSYTQETRTVCAEQDTKKNFLGLPMCKRTVDSKVSCTRTEASYVLIPKLIDVESGQIVFSNTYKESATASSCSDSTTPAPVEGQLLEQAKSTVLDRFRRAIAPSYARLNIQLMESDAGIGEDVAKRKLAQGLEFAKANRLDRACELWREAGSSVERSVSLAYDLGICAEAGGDIRRAAELYQQADLLLEKPDDRVSLALTRIEKAKADQAKFDRQRQTN
jgi:hypothetical protein